MKITQIFSIIGCLALWVSVGNSRTWTSADGSKTFEGDFRSYNATTGEVSIVRDGTLIRVKKELLSEADIKFATEVKAEVTTESIAEELKEQKVGAVLANSKLHRLDGKRFRKAEIEAVPEYYLLYFSASW